MFCSTVIPTIGRSTLSRAVCSILDQSLESDDFEVIVVNDSGRPLPQADWQQSRRVRIINTNQCNRSVARNAGAATARGKFLHFLDDDDWVLPDTLRMFWALGRTSDAGWLYGASQLVDSNGRLFNELHLGMSGNVLAQVMAGEWIPLQASLIKSEVFFAAGGFDPLMPVGQDKDLCARVAAFSSFASTPTTVASILRGVGWETSTDYARSRESGYQSREKLLSRPGILSRMRSSASSSYWHGRILRVYLISALWNLRRKTILTAMSRATFGAASFVLAGRQVLSPDFWRALTTPHVSRTRTPHDRVKTS
ncbi:MAG TPA: hypothetical protein DEP84_06495 [Chloroflexi bacterium]|nr:hypothetical protein [Chloroflexota bacterium]